MSNHTKGPWEIVYVKKDKTWPGLFAVISGLPLEFGMDGEEGIYADNEHDLILIAAAPELLEALKLAKEDLITAAMIFQALNKEKGTVSPVAEQFRGKVRTLESIIAKAEGSNGAP